MTTGNTESETRAAPLLGVGQMLRSAREKAGKSLQDVSAATRITPTNLAALEAERFSDLPAPIYALGFVRTYANYLDLDAEEAVRRMKLENAGARAAKAVSFPKPTDRGRGPAGRLALIALLVALAVYGVWYVTAQTGRNGELIFSSAPPPSDTLPAAAPEPEPEQAAPIEEVAAPVSGQPDDSAPEDIPDISAPPPELALVTPEPPETVALAPETEISGAVAALPEAPAPEMPPPEIPHDGSASPAVRLLAIADAWIEVKRADGEVITTRVLLAGEEYVPPDEPGLRLTTGNAGALEIYVNGQVVAPLGRRGVIVRAVPLDPASLAAGAAPLP